jgi:1-deoxy-D-xylulose-5-phosphate reductoisomerase
MLEQARRFNVKNLVVGDSLLAGTQIIDEIKNFTNAEGDEGFFGLGDQALLELINNTQADLVVNSLVGAAGLQSSVATLKSGKQLALANKESLVVGGDLIMPLAAKQDAIRQSNQSEVGVLAAESAPRANIYAPIGSLVPIDSEHGAIFQCLLGEDMSQVDSLWVTASGGPFRGRTTDDLRSVTAKDALAHPTWNMGPKITIDSSTLMNKGLEVIEAHHLFAMPYEQIKVVVQPQSAIHSMVEFVDGSVKAHLGTTDMKIPIQFAISYPHRWDSPAKRLDFRQLGSLDFEAPDTSTFKCLALATQAGKAGGTLPAAMNAANEVAVAAFLEGRCGFLDIANTVEKVMDETNIESVSSIEQLLEVDRLSRLAAKQHIDAL